MNKTGGSLPEDHVKYEIFMFLTIYGELSGKFVDFYTNDGSRNKVLGNALLESFMIHTRNLLDFLYESSSNLDDIISSDFMPGGRANYEQANKSNFSVNCEDYVSLKTRINKQISHLTYTRTTIEPSEKEWTFRKIVFRLCTDLNQWISKVDKTKIDQTIMKELQDALTICLDDSGNLNYRAVNTSTPVSMTSSITTAVFTHSSSNDRQDRIINEEKSRERK